MRHRLATRLAALTCSLVLLAPAAALAQDGNPFDGQLPPPQPNQAATPEPADPAGQDAVGRNTLWVIGGGIAVALLGFGFWISRDARGKLPREERDERRGPDGKPVLAHKHERQAKARARAKGRAQRQARKAHRRKAKR